MRVNPLLKKQGDNLNRIIKLSGINITDLAKKLEVERLTFYNWIQGKCPISEDKLVELSIIFDADPAEIRYGTNVFNKNDLVTVLTLVERELAQRDITASPEKKAAVVAALYQLYQTQKRILHKEFQANAFCETAEDFIVGTFCD